MAAFPPTRAVWPVWRDSTRKPVKPPAPPTKAEAQRLYYRLEDFERRTRQPGRQDGAVTRNGLAVARALIWGFLNWRTGQLDPAYQSIAQKACISLRSAARGLQALRRIGFLHWVRRCAEVYREGRYSLEQETNVYALRPASQWLGYTGPVEAPPPDAGTWGDHPCSAREALTEAVAQAHAGGTTPSIVQQLEADPTDRLAAALARLGRAIGAQPSGTLPECQPGKETIPSLMIEGSNMLMR